MTKDTNLMELLSSKIFHDLAGPIGAINNGIDFLDDKDEALRKKAFDLVLTSSNDLVAKLKLFRYAYGNLNNFNVNLGELKDFARKIFVNPKIEVIIEVDDNTEISNILNKIIINILIISNKLLFNSGSVKISDNKNQIRINLTKESFNNLEEIEQFLDNNIKTIEPTPQNIHLYYTFLNIYKSKLGFSTNRTINSLKFILNY